MSKIIVLKKGLVTFIVAFAAVASVALSAIITSVSVQTRSTAMMTVVIDPGHGGIDGGVTGVATGALESELNLAVAKLLRDDFRAAGFRVVMTRSTSAGLYGNAQGSLKRADMQNRKKIIEKAEPDLVLSIHMNKFELQSRRGAQVFYKAKDEQSSLLAESIQGCLNGMDEAPRQCFTLAGDYYVLNVSPCPAVIVECGFLSNAEDEALLVTEAYREKLAYTIFTGAISYLTRVDAFCPKAP